MKKVIILISVIFYINTTHASNNFNCIVTDATDVDKNGMLQNKYVAKNYTGSTFVVDRETGKMIGDISNYNSNAKPVTHNYFPDENGFKAITTYSPHPAVDYLFIQEYVEKAKKPFLYLSSSTLISGTCVYY